MMLLACLTSLLGLLATTAFANTEKVIFIAPAPISLPHNGPSLASLSLDTLSAPQQSSLRRALPVAFPTDVKPRGIDSWYLLPDLLPGRRYEVRLCWAATQPTEFWLHVYNITHVFDKPSLISSLSSFAEQQHSLRDNNQTPSNRNNFGGSILFLQVQSAADYFTTNQTLMQHPPFVDVDIILDPYLANVFPKSLLPTAAYLAALAVAAWSLSGVIWNFLQPQTQHKQHTN